MGAATAPWSLTELARVKSLDPQWLAKLGVKDGPRGAIDITYYDDSGRELFVRRRNSPGVSPRFRQPYGISLVPYGLWRLGDAQRDGTLYLCEGESDTWAMWSAGLPALGIPGDNATGCLEAQHLSGISRVYLLPDHPVRPDDNSGEVFALGMRRRLESLDWLGECRRCNLPEGVKDVGDLYAAGPRAFPNRLQEMVQSSVRYLAPRPAIERNGHGGNGHVNGKTTKVPATPKAPTPRDLPPYRPFPLEVLPDPLRSFVRESAAAMGCDPTYVALPALAVCASAIGNSRVLHLKRKWSEACILWPLIVGESGTLKTPAYYEAVAPLLDAQEGLFWKYSSDQDEYRKAKEAYKEERVKAREKGWNPPEEPKEPIQRKLICGDTTIEKLAEILHDNPRGVLVARDEAAGWFHSFTRYKSQGSDAPAWLELFRGGALLIDRKTGDRKQLFIRRASVSITGGIPPRTLGRILTPEMFESGLAARLLLAEPPRKPKRWTEAEIGQETEDAYHLLVHQLLALPMEQLEGSPAQLPYRLRLSPEAKDLWVPFYNSWADVQAAAEGELAAAFSKLEGYAARFALLHHVVQHVALESNDIRPVGPASIIAGSTLSRWFAGEAERLYGASTETDEERSARTLIEWVRGRGGRTTTRELQKSNGRRYPTAASAQAALDALSAAGLATWEEIPAPELGGHPTRSLKLAPTPDTRSLPPPMRRHSTGAPTLDRRQ